VEAGDPNVKIHWSSQDSHLLINPRLPAADIDELRSLFAWQNWPGHICIASSGSARRVGESLKLVALSKKALMVAALASNRHLQVTSSDVWIRALPRFHVGGLAVEVRALLADLQVSSALRESGSAGTAKYTEEWDPHYFVEKTLREGGTLSSLVPTQVHDLLTEGLISPPSLRAVVVGGAALSTDLYQRARLMGWPLLPSYGLTEAGSQVATAEVGTLQSYEFPRLKVLDHCRVHANAEGVLAIRSESLLTGYSQWRDGKKHWEVPLYEGWYATSDRVEVSSQNGTSYLRPLGRERDIVKIKGEGVSLQLLREKLDHIVADLFPDLLFQLVLTDIPHLRDGAELILFVAAGAESSVVERILQNFQQQVSPVERISRVTKIGRIPRTTLGKIQWDQLRLLSDNI